MVVSEEERLEAVERLLLDGDVRLAVARTLTEGIAEIGQVNPDLVILALPLPGVTAVQALSACHEADSRLPVVVLTSADSTREAIEATKAGAFDYLLEPCDPGELLDVIGKGIETGRLARSPVRLDQEDRAPIDEALIGRSKPMQEIYKGIGRVARTDSTVLIRGESGTGKELVARAIYQHSRRAGRPFVIVNCVAIPDTLLESELFGHERGAFTGAVARRIGKVEQADGGTLFLDEIGDMAAAVQAKLLRLLEDRRVERVGGRQPIPVDVRIVAATNRDLEAALGTGRFRGDLYYRLNVVQIFLPPLRERIDDVPMLAEYFLRRLTGQLGIRNPGITEEGLALLQSHSWPGNVRELANAIEQCLIFGRGRPIGGEEVAALVLGAPASVDDALKGGDDALRTWVHQSVAFGREGLLTTAVDHVTRRTIAELLVITGGNRTRTARLLGVSRPTLLAKMAKLGLR